MPLFGKRRKQNQKANFNYSSPNLLFQNASQPPAYPQSPPQWVRPYHQTPPTPYLQHAGTKTNINLPVEHLPPYASTQPWASCASLPAQLPPQIPSRPQIRPSQGLQDYIGDKFSDVISLIDEETYPFADRDFIITFDPPSPTSPPLPTPPLSPQSTGRSNPLERSLIPSRTKPKLPDRPKPPDRSINVLSKISLYHNSRLPPSLPPLRLYMASWPLICLAGEYSTSAYKKPLTQQKDHYINADVKLGTKAMVVKSVPMDDAGLIIFAIRGTSLLSPRDWSTNMSTTPVSPAGFLDDPGNLVHEGFMRVARAMLLPIAARLRFLLEENPSRTSCSLLITGHSAGGAVASLLYSHMLTAHCPSELSILTGCFKRIHCVTFGAPPVSLLPLWKPEGSEQRLRKSLFLSFMNEGDVVCRAEKSYVRSLVELLASPPPPPQVEAPRNPAKPSSSRLDLSKTKKPDHTKQRRATWKLPQGTLSNAGRLVVLRASHPHSGDKGKSKRPGTEGEITASVVSDEQLRGVVWGDPFAHSMDVYCRRVEWLATRAVTGRLAG